MCSLSYTFNTQTGSCNTQQESKYACFQKCQPISLQQENYSDNVWEGFYRGLSKSVYRSRGVQPNMRKKCYDFRGSCGKSDKSP